MKLLMCYVVLALSIVVPNQVTGKLPKFDLPWGKPKPPPLLEADTLQAQFQQSYITRVEVQGVSQVKYTETTPVGHTNNKAKHEQELAEVQKQELSLAQKHEHLPDLMYFSDLEIGQELKVNNEHKAAIKERAERHTLEKVIPSDFYVFFESASLFEDKEALKSLVEKIKNHQPSADPDNRPAENIKLGEECIEMARDILVDKYADMHPYERVWTLSIVAVANDFLIPRSRGLLIPEESYLDLKPMDERTTQELQVVRDFSPRISVSFRNIYEEFKAVNQEIEERTSTSREETYPEFKHHMPRKNFKGKKDKGLSEIAKLPMTYQGYRTNDHLGIYTSREVSPADSELVELLDRFYILRKFAGLKAKICPMRVIETEDIVLKHLWQRNLPQEEDQAQELINALREMFKGTTAKEWGGDYASALLKHLHHFPSFTQKQLEKSLEDPDFLRGILEPYAKKALIGLLDTPDVKSLEPEVLGPIRKYCGPRREENMECLMRNIHSKDIHKLIHVEVVLHPDEAQKVIDIIKKEDEFSFIENWLTYGRGKKWLETKDALFEYGSWIFKKYSFEFQILYGRYLAKKMEDEISVYGQHTNLIASLRSLPLDPNGMPDDKFKKFYDLVLQASGGAHTSLEYPMELETLLVVLGAYKQAPELLLKHMDENVLFRDKMAKLSKSMLNWNKDYFHEEKTFFSKTTSPEILKDFCKKMMNLYAEIWKVELHDSEKARKIQQKAVEVKPPPPF
ncbi:hypothetical protein CROQUDRAFT_718926 [Cronartium quercuum f. sp. fusiforme G11]|uniref:Uncharacterized protein n=1 Tax=Cronartium quercuum f. sp. fusiforme G11 TaxID=708437 RepID=A0A9P6N5I8_9BASI|nr:hypothetical protein CROQUDRAFT_718926 [Cronartium quercuum f. sp. fusiforme G11]